MHSLVTLLLVVAVHLSRAVAAWTQVGLLSDDRHMVGAAVLRHRGVWSFASMFAPEPPPPGSATALYRPFVDLLFWLEQPWFGVEPFGYHVTNSVLHCGTALVWSVLVRRLSGSTAAGLACALLFAGWPSHSEATHWIAARTNVSSTFLFSSALLLFDCGLTARGARRGAWLAAATAVGVASVGAKESAVLMLPLAAGLAWLRAAPQPTRAARLRQALAAFAPLLLGVLAWLAWRAHLLGTWGSGTHYGWQASRVGLTACADWLELLLAPRHRGYTAPLWSPVLWLLHGGLLGAAVLALRHAAARRAALPGAMLLAGGYLAGIGLETMDPATLENARYSYEPVLGLAVLGGLGLAALPTAARGVLLAALVFVHAAVLDGNRQSWLGAAAVYRQMEAGIVAVARTTQQPIRVLQAPGVHEGAFALLNGFTEFQFMQAFAPEGTNLRGRVSSTQEWPAVLGELAAAAAAGEALANTYVVQWDDGALVPFALDTRWPRTVAPGLDVAYAWLPRWRPFAGTRVPVQLLVAADAPLELQATAALGARQWSGTAMRVEPGRRPVQLWLPLPADLEPGVPVDVRLVLRAGDARHELPLGATVPAARPGR
ncbi:MAG: hypothetical protein KF830_06270 [Planctomycetes bacterium]|nr:hypothetical protein [Planctomycetota bacterium]